MNEIIKSAILRKIRRDKAREDINYFTEYYLPHLLINETPLFHREILKLLREESRVAVAAPRGFAKSTLVQLIYGLHCLLFNEGEDILTISMSANLAEDWIRKLKFELEGNEKIKTDFGMLLKWGEKDSKKWTADHLVIQKENRVWSQVRARGRGCQVRGLRPTKVFCDDLEDEELVRSEEQRKFMREWFLGALLNVLTIDQQLVVIGTILHPLALLSEIVNKREQFARWETRKYKALTDGKSLWEDRFPVKDLERRKFEVGTYAFEAEYQNNPIASDVCLWKPEWVLTFKKLPKIKLSFAALDPASTSKEYSDNSAIVVIGVGEDGNLYEIFSAKGKWGLWELLNKIIEVNNRYHPIRFGIEEVAFQNVIRKVLVKKTQDERLRRIPVEAMSLGRYTGVEKKRRQPKDKFTRALSVVHYWEQGSVYLRNQQLIDQISLFPTGSEDDMVDAMVWCIKLIMKYSPIKVMVKKPERELTGIQIKNNKIPCFAKVEDCFKPHRDWRLGG